MFDKYDPAKVYEKKTDWGAVFGAILLIGIGILVLAAQ